VERKASKNNFYAKGKHQQQQTTKTSWFFYGIVKIQKILPRHWKLAKEGGLFVGRFHPKEREKI